LSLAYGCGLRACEVSLKVCDIDSAQMERTFAAYALDLRAKADFRCTLGSASLLSNLMEVKD
jgi:hypothetical protein